MKSSQKLTAAAGRRKSGGLKTEGPKPLPLGSACRVEAATVLSAEAEHELAVRIKAGDLAAREALTLANMRLVITIACQFKTRGMELDDLIQEGNLGLIRATEDFDPESHATRFSTYASYWIRHYIMKAASDDGSMIHFPYYLVTLRNRFNRVKAEMVGRLQSESGGDRCEPSVEDVAESMGVKARRLRFLQNTQVDVTSYSTSTLDAEEAGASEDQISEERPPEQPLETAEEMEGLYAALGHLPKFEAWLLKRRYRLDDRADDVPTDARKRPRARSDEARSRSRAHRDRALEARRIKRANDQSDEPRSYREIERECGLAVYRLKQIESQALEKLKMALARAAHAPRSLPIPEPRPARRAPRRVSA